MKKNLFILSVVLLVAAGFFVWICGVKEVSYGGPRVELTPSDLLLMKNGYDLCSDGSVAYKIALYWLFNEKDEVKARLWLKRAQDLKEQQALLWDLDKLAPKREPNGQP